MADSRNGEVRWQLKIDAMKFEKMDAKKKEVILLQISSSLYKFSVSKKQLFLENPSDPFCCIIRLFLQVSTSALDGWVTHVPEAKEAAERCRNHVYSASV